MPLVSRKRRMVAEEEEEEEDENEDPEQEPTRGTQRRRQQPPSADDLDDDSEDGENDGPSGLHEMESEDQDGSKALLVKKLVRYALACEYARISIKRDGIKDKVLGKHRVPFKQVFEGAQEQLKTKFGMEMVELPLKDKITLKERRAAQKTSQVLASSKTYVLTSILPPAYRVPEIISPSIAPTQHAEASYTALYTMIITLITLCGGTLSDAKLDRYLKRMNADVNMPTDKTEATLQKMIKQGYLIKIKENVSGDEATDWVVGPRGRIEVGNKGITGLVESVYGDSAPDDLSDRIKSSLGLDHPKAGINDGQRPEEQSGAGAEIQPRRRGRPRVRIIDHVHAAEERKIGGESEGT